MRYLLVILLASWIFLGSWYSMSWIIDQLRIGPVFDTIPFLGLPVLWLMYFSWALMPLFLIRAISRVLKS